MATISTNNLARAIYESSLGKEGDSLDFVVKNAVKLMSDKHLLGKSKKVLDKLEKIVNENEESVKVKIGTRKRLDNQTKNEIENFIKERYKVKNVFIEESIDEKLLGGIKLEVGDEVMDLTLKNKIHKLKDYLINNQIYGKKYNRRKFKKTDRKMER